MQISRGQFCYSKDDGERPLTRVSSNRIDRSNMSLKPYEHAAYLGPAVTLGLVFVVRPSSLEDGLLGTATSCDLADSSTAGAGQNLEYGGSIC